MFSFPQVITGCEGSLVRAWNLETGKKVFEFHGTDGKDEMSCMSLEVNGRRLFTGSRTGMVYVRKSDIYYESHPLTLSCSCSGHVFKNAKLTIRCFDLTIDLDLGKWSTAT